MGLIRIFNENYLNFDAFVRYIFYIVGSITWCKSCLNVCICANEYDHHILNIMPIKLILFINISIFIQLVRVVYSLNMYFAK